MKYILKNPHLCDFVILSWITCHFSFLWTNAKLHLLKFKNHKRNNQYYQNEINIEYFLLEEQQTSQILAVIILSLSTPAEKVLLYSGMLYQNSNMLVLTKNTDFMIEFWNEHYQFQNKKHLH